MRRKIRRAGLGLALLAGATAQAQAPTRVLEASAPRSASTAAELTRPEGLTVVGFDEAVRQALARNPSVAQAQAQVDRAQALVTQARASYLPTLSANLAYTQLDHDRVQADRVLQAASSLNANAALSVPLVVPQRWLAARRASQSVDVAKDNAADVRRAVAANVGAAYLAVVLQRRLLEANVQARDTAKAHLGYASARLKEGLGNKLDEARSEREVHDNEARVKLGVAALARAREALGVAVGAEGPLDADGAPELSEIPSLQSALETVDQRQDVVLQRSRLGLAERAVKDSWADFSPTLSATGQPFYQAPPTPTLPRWGFQAQVLLSVPLYDGGFRYGARHEREATVAEAKAALDVLEQRARGEVRSAAEQLVGAEAAEVEQRQSMEAAKQTLELATLSYRTGTVTSLDVIDAERGARDAETSALLAQDTVRQARLNLLLASGRFPGPDAAR